MNLEETDVTPQAPEETAVEVAAAGDTGDEEEPTVRWQLLSRRRTRKTHLQLMMVSVSTHH